MRALIAEDPSRARDAVTQLAGLLRYTLRSDHEELVTLERELKTVGDYLALESLRLGDRMRVELDIAAGAQGDTRSRHAAADGGRECDQAWHRGVA